MADTTGTIRSTIVINSADAQENIDKLKASIADAKKNDGKSTAFDGMVREIKELQGLLKSAQVELKSLRKQEKSQALEGLMGEARDAEGRLKTLRQQLGEIQKLKDTAFQTNDSAGMAKYGAEEARVYKELLQFQGTLQKAQDAIATKKLSDYNAYQKQEAKIHGQIMDNQRIQESAQFTQYNAKVAMDAKYDQYLRKESLIANKANTSDSYRRELAQDSLYQRDERKQNSIYNGYYGSIDKQNTNDAKRDIAQSQAYQKQQKLNDDANDKYMVAREKRYQAEMALDNRQSAAYQANQRKQFQSHIDSIVKQENAEKVSYDQYLNRLANKYNAQGKANDNANDKYIAGLARQDAKEAQLFAQYQRRQKQADPSNPQNYANLQSQIRGAANEAERLWVAQNKSKTPDNVSAYNEAQVKLRGLVATQEQYNTSLGRSSGLLDGFGRRVKSHLEWIAGGALLAGLFSIPMEGFDAIKKVDSAMAGMQQVSKDLHGNQQAVNIEAQKFIDIAATYGESIENIVKAGTSWGRMYKDLNIVNALTHQSAIVAVADNMSLIDANKGVEASMFQYGMVAKDTTEAMAYSGKVIDVVTKLAHTAGTTAQDLFAAIGRTGSVARLAGVDFEFLNAMVATATRGTQLSGENIGNMFKSVLGSIHSKKATEEIEAMGIATTKVGKDGVVELRKAQDVLLDISVQAQGSEKNLEDLFKAVSGGKFQWAKTAAMLGDYKTFIATWGDAVNSVGFAGEQVKIQMDTISRRIQRLVADLQGLAIDNGNNGLAKYWKEQLAGIDNIVLGLKKIPTAAVNTVTAIGVLSIGLSALSRVYNSITIAATEASAATTVFGKASAFASKSNIIMAALSVAAVVIGTYAESLGKASSAERDALQSKQDSIAVSEQQMEQMKKQGEFVDAMFSSREKLIAQSNDESKSAEKKILINQDIAATEQELTKVLGDAAMERIRQSGWSVDQINIEKGEFIKAQDAKKIALNEMKVGMAADLDNKIEWLQNCVAAYYQEVDAFKDSISKKIALLGIWKAAMLTANEWGTSINEKRRDNALQKLQEPNLSPNAAAALEQVVASANNEIEYNQNQGKLIIQEGAKNWEGQLAVAQKDRLAITTGNVNFKDIGAGGNNYEPPAGSAKDKSNGSLPPTDPSLKIKRDSYGEAVTLAMHNAKLATDAYSASLDTLNNKEEIYGKTAKSTGERLLLMQSRRKTLNDQEWSSDFMADGLEDKIGNSNGVLGSIDVSVDAWRAMTHAQKGEILLQKRDIVEQHAEIKAETTAYYKWSEDASKNHLEGIKMDNDIKKMALGDSMKPTVIHQKALESIERSAESLRKYRETATENYRYLGELEKQLRDAQIVLDKAKNDDAKESAKRSLETAQEAYDKQKLIIDKAYKEQVRLDKDKNAKIQQGFYDITEALTIEGNKWSSIRKGIVKSMAQDALKIIMGVKNDNPGLVTQLFQRANSSDNGITGRGGNTNANIVKSLANIDWLGKSSTTTPKVSTGVNTDWLGTFAKLGSGFKLWADGDIVTKPTLGVIGEAGEEANINLAKLGQGDARQKALLSYANSKLGTNVVASVSPKTIATAQSISQNTAVSREHLDKLTESNNLMSKQLQVMTYMANQSNKGNSQPVIMPISNAQSDEGLLAQLQRMKSMGYPV